MAKQAYVTIRIRNWEKYKGRKDVEHNSWFRCSNRLLEDPDFFDFTAEQILVWIYLLSVSSQKNSDIVTVNLAHADRVCRLKTQVVLSAIEKLKENQIDILDDTATLRTRNANDTETGATNRQTDKQTDMTGGSGAEPNADPFGPKELAGIWNDRMARMKSVRGKAMPLVDLSRFRSDQERWSSAKARIAEESSPEFWIEVIDRMARSEFCRGKDARGDWVANFDFLVRPKTATAVMEGQYGCAARVAAISASPVAAPSEPDLDPAPFLDVNNLRPEFKRLLKSVIKTPEGA